jgi:hypothetical protein
MASTYRMETCEVQILTQLSHKSGDYKTQRSHKIMARVAMVTRTLATTKVSVLCLDIEKATPFTKELVLAGTFKDEKSQMKAVSAQVDVENKVKAVHVTKSENIETLYGMTEAEFIKLAKVLPARGTNETQAATGTPCTETK